MSGCLRAEIHGIAFLIMHGLMSNNAWLSFSLSKKNSSTFGMVAFFSASMFYGVVYSPLPVHLNSKCEELTTCTFLQGQT